MQDELTLVERYQSISAENFDFAKCFTRTNGEGAMIEKDVVMALKASEGNISKAAALLGVGRTSVARFVQQNPDLHSVLDEYTETIIDVAEDVLKEQVKEGDGAQVRFLLNTKGKNRGYTTRQEMTGKDGAALDFMKVAQVRMDDEQMERIAEAITAKRQSS